jgi:aminomethyltransferase
MGQFVDFAQPGDFIGREALKKISVDGPRRRLVGIEIHGDALASPNEEFWDITDGATKVGHVTRCAYSPRLERNIGWANVPTDYAEVGTELVVVSPLGELAAVVCEAPWFKPQIKIPDDMKG